jgi:Tfp pilus assembly protein PilO
MSAKRKWILFAGLSVLVAAGAGALIYLQRQTLEKNRAKAEALRVEIEAGRELVAGTPALEREVIVQRETDVVIKEILSEEAEVNALAKTINDYAANAGVFMQSVKRAKTNTREKSKGSKDFDQVGYSIQFDGDAFQLLSLLNAFETHKRFISVTSIKLSAAKRAQTDRGELPLHNVTLELETYVYHPKQGAKEARVDNYERKRDMLLAEIQKRAEGLRVRVYEYRGPRGRRDPWIDPRLPITGPEPILAIEEQIQIIEDLEKKLDRVLGLWDGVEKADNLIAEMKARAEIEEAILDLDANLSRVEGENVITFGPLVVKLENVIVGGVKDVKKRLEAKGGDLGPSARELEQVAAAVNGHIEREEYEQALQAFHSMEPRLVRAERDPSKAQAVEDLRVLAGRAQTVLDFSAIEMSIGGVAVMDGARPVALINGESVSAGEYIDMSGDLFVHDIRSHEIEFVYQGVTLVRRIDDTGTTTPPKKKRK